MISREGVKSGTLSPHRFDGTYEKQIRWHHGEAAFVLNHFRMTADTGGAVLCVQSSLYCQKMFLMTS